MSEPLKNKVTEPVSIAHPDDLVFYYGDVLSAVEWLKERIDNMSKNKVIYQYSPQELLDVVEEIIDEAFSDVIKDGERE